MSILTSTGILSGSGILDGTGNLFQSGILVPPLGNANALAYIALVEAAGATVSGAQRTALNEFYDSAEAEGYYTSLKRLYLPIWGVAAANAIDMIGGTSGTFNGGVTHGAGFVQGNGTTGYFDAGATYSAMGISTGSSSIFTLVKSGVAGASYSGFSEFDGGALIGTSGGVLVGRCPSSLSQFVTAITGTTGIFVMSQTATAARALYRRLTAGFTTVGSNTTSDSAAFPNLNPYFAGATNVPPTATSFHNTEYGAYGSGVGLDITKTTAFTLHLKNLWESCTGLTLP